MDISISDVKGYYIYFDSEFGASKAHWRGEVPNVGDSYTVEIEIDDQFCLGENLYENSEQIFQITTCKNYETFTGCLESVDEDGYAILRIKNNIIPFVIDGPCPKVGSFIKIITNKIYMYPFAY